MRLKLKAPKKKRFVNSKRSFKEYSSLYSNNENPQKHFRWQNIIDREKLAESLAASFNISFTKKPTPNRFENCDPSDHKVLFVKLPNRTKTLAQHSPTTTGMLVEKDTHSSLHSMIYSEQFECASNLASNYDYHSEEVNEDKTQDKPQEDFDTTLQNFISWKPTLPEELDRPEKNYAMITESENMTRENIKSEESTEPCPVKIEMKVESSMSPKSNKSTTMVEESTHIQRESFTIEDPSNMSFRSFRDSLPGEREMIILGDDGKYTPKPVKEILSERAANIERNRYLNQADSLVTPDKVDDTLSQKPFPNIQRLEGLSESIQKSVHELNEKISLTKSSVSKLKKANNNEQNIAQEQQKPQDANDCSEHLELERFSLMTPEASRHDHTRENHSFPKPSCQKSLYKRSVHKETPISREIFVDGSHIPNLDRICSCKPKSSVIKCTQECETPSKRIHEKVTWVTNSDVQVKLNKAERLRMDFIRKKAQTTVKSPAKQGKNTSDSEKSWSVGKTNLLF